MAARCSITFCSLPSTRVQHKPYLGWPELCLFSERNRCCHNSGLSDNIIAVRALNRCAACGEFRGVSSIITLAAAGLVVSSIGLSGIPARHLGDQRSATNMVLCTLSPTLGMVPWDSATLADSWAPAAPFLASFDRSMSPFNRADENQPTGLMEGRIRPCPSSINPNCVSTSSAATDAYAAPWRVPSGLSKDTAVRKLRNAITTVLDSPEILESEDLPDGHFFLVEADGPFGRDSVEILLKRDVVLFRSLAGKVRYIYPFTTPLTDFGAQRKRMEALGDALGWTEPLFF